MTRVVYIITNHDTGQAYAGLTEQFERRISDHRRTKPYLFAGNHTVQKTSPMGDEDARRIEARAVRFLRAVGLEPVNLAKPGSLGGRRWCWTKSHCASEALKYSTRRAFEMGTRSAYTAALRKGWLDEICAHMTPAIKPKGYWTKERCAIEALKYTGRKQFFLNAASAYVAARTNGWLDDACAHMQPLQKPAGYWTKERCGEVAAKFDTRSAFMIGAKSVYNVSHRNGWIDDVCAHMRQPKRSIGRAV